MSTLVVGSAVYKVIDYNMNIRTLFCICENYEASNLANMWINAATEKAVSEFLNLDVKSSYAEKWNLNKYADRFVESSHERLKIDDDKVNLCINDIEQYDIYGLFLKSYNDKTQQASFTFDRSYIRLERYKVNERE